MEASSSSSSSSESHVFRETIKYRRKMKITMVCDRTGWFKKRHTTFQSTNQNIRRIRLNMVESRVKNLPRLFETARDCRMPHIISLLFFCQGCGDRALTTTTVRVISLLQKCGTTQTSPIHFVGRCDSPFVSSLGTY